MRLQLLRHATLHLQYAGLRLLVDPMLSPARAMEPVQNAANPLRIPLVEIPLSEAELAALVAQLDAVLVTHRHRDHWDAAAAQKIPRQLPLFCQPGDEPAFREEGFTQVEPVAEHLSWRGLRLSRTGGEHGAGEIGEKMGKVSGFVLDGRGEPRLYLAGDTIWCAETAAAILAYRPEVIVVNAGAAQFLSGGPITMDAAGVIAAAQADPLAQVVAVHLEAVNHCELSRQALRQAVQSAGLSQRVAIPADGETLVYAAIAAGAPHL